jgi:CDP-diacylglycerol--glycerol-3-phosphate 3-phosphatidyltransferase
MRVAGPADRLKRQAANILTGGRLLLVFVAVGFSIAQSQTLQWLAVPAALLALLTDWLDGMAARRWHTDSKIGGVMDIAGDRIVEAVWWVTFAWLRLIPLWVPIVVISRGVLTDAVRSFALSRGLTAFGGQTMMRSRVGFAVVASRASRGIYCAAKVLAFCGLFALNAVHGSSEGTGGLEQIVTLGALAATYLTVFLCIARGIPVLVESRQLFSPVPGYRPAGDTR